MNKEKIHWSEQKNEIFAALAKAQGDIMGANKESKNPFFNSKYADLYSIWLACKDALSAQSICVLQSTFVTPDDKEIFLCTTLGHSSGQWIMSEIKLDIPPPGSTETDKYGKEKKINIMQATGSLMTYQKRYQLCSIVGVAPKEDDDDGNASNYTSPQKQPLNEEPKPINGGYIPFISDQQLLDIQNLLSLCDPTYGQSIRDWLKSIKMDDLSRMTVPVYEDLKPKLEASVIRAKNNPNSAI